MPWLAIRSSSASRRVRVLLTTKSGRHGPVAQQIEQVASNHQAGGANPSRIIRPRSSITRALVYGTRG